MREEAAATTPFGTLLHFKKDIATAQPRVLLVAPLSGHFSTPLRATVRTMLPDHDVYITDWHNARDVPLTAGRFGMDEYRPSDQVLGKDGTGIAHPGGVSALRRRARRRSGDGAGRQPGAAAVDDADGRSIDTRVNPTKVNELAKTRTIEWFERTLTASVPFAIPARSAASIRASCSSSPS